MGRGLHRASADRGHTAYNENCARCHGAALAGGESTPPLTGAAFLSRWTGKSAPELLDRTRRTMPTDNPGGLAARQYADIVAYVLSVNRFRPGADDLGDAATRTAGRPHGRMALLRVRRSRNLVASCAAGDGPLR